MFRERLQSKAADERPWRLDYQLPLAHGNSLYYGEGAVTKRIAYNGWQTRIEIHIHD